MSKPPSTSTEILGIPAIQAFTRAAEAKTLDGDTSLAGAMARERIRGGASRRKTNDPYLFAGMWNAASPENIGLGGAGRTSTIESATDLMDRIRQVGGALQSGFIIGGLSALKAYDLYSESKNSVLRRTADAPDGTRARAATPDAPDGTRTRTATPDAPERSVARAATGAAEEVAEAGSRGLFGRALGALGVGARFLKRVPVLGAAITTAFVVYEVGSHAVNGRGTAAVGAAFAGAAEIGGNFIGFGAGDALREGTREAFVRASSVAGYDGAFDDVHVSDIRALVEAGLELRTQFADAAAPPPAGQQYVPAAAHYTPSFVAA